MGESGMLIPWPLALLSPIKTLISFSISSFFPMLPTALQFFFLPSICLVSVAKNPVLGPTPSEDGQDRDADSLKGQTLSSVPDNRKRKPLHTAPQVLLEASSDLEPQERPS